MEDYIDNKTGKSFPQAAINGGYIFILFSPVFVMDSPLIGVALFFVGLLVSFTVSGVRIDLKNKKFKEYTRYYWIKIGNWISLKQYPFITMMNIRESSEAFSFSKNDTSLDNILYGIYLLDNKQTNKILIKKFKDKDEAILELSELAGKLGVRVVNI